jgi:spore coat protein A
VSFFLTRRDFLQAALLATHNHRPATPAKAPPLVDVTKLAKFVDSLSKPPIAEAVGLWVDPDHPKKKLPFYRIPMRPVLAKVHRDLPVTPSWSYGGSVPGPTIEARRGEAVLVEWPNQLPAKHMFAIDHNLMGAEADKPAVRTVVHLHGAKVPPQSDGYPESWYTAGRAVTYRYPNEQDATVLWYHDHAMGINRLNMMAGLFGLYVIRDEEEEALDLPPSKYEIPLVLFDRMLRPDGQLYYPVSEVDGAPWIPEFFGDAVLVNGKISPYLEVEARPYRFRLANVSNGRFYNLSLTSGDNFHQIATDQGLLPAPVALSTVFLAPAERTDVIVDFSRAQGQQIVLRNGAVDILKFRVAGIRACGSHASCGAAPRGKNCGERGGENTLPDARRKC